MPLHEQYIFDEGDGLYANLISLSLRIVEVVQYDSCCRFLI